jgi:hypothetical protein
VAYVNKEDVTPDLLRRLWSRRHDTERLITG